MKYITYTLLAALLGVILSGCASTFSNTGLIHSLTGGDRFSATR